MFNISLFPHIFIYLLVALTFIDKYTQIPRLLAPISNCITSLMELHMQGMNRDKQTEVMDKNLHLLDHYIKEEWGCVDGVILQILSDFYKHGFDGSGMLYGHICWNSIYIYVFMYIMYR